MKIWCIRTVFLYLNAEDASSDRCIIGDVCERGEEKKETECNNRRDDGHVNLADLSSSVITLSVSLARGKWWAIIRQILRAGETNDDFEKLGKTTMTKREDEIRRLSASHVLSPSFANDCSEL